MFARRLTMNDSTVSTKNTQLASFLVAKGHRLIRATQEANSTLFCFNSSEALVADVQTLKFGDDLISARRLFEARNYLLSLIHDDQGLRR
jgi:hypothetical protein